VLFMRTYAIWDRKRSVLILLTGGLGTAIVVTMYLTLRYFASTTPAGVHLFHQGCLLIFPNRIEWVSLVILFCCETIALSLLLVKRLTKFRHSALMHLIFKDGVLYYLCIVAVTIANLLVLLIASSTLDTFLLIPQSILHSILCNRLLLRIRGAYESLSVHPQHGDGGYRSNVPSNVPMLIMSTREVHVD